MIKVIRQMSEAQQKIDQDLIIMEPAAVYNKVRKKARWKTYIDSIAE